MSNKLNKTNMNTHYIHLHTNAFVRQIWLCLVLLIPHSMMAATGISWYITITDADGHAKALSFSFDDDSSTTAIENVTRQEDAAVQTDGFVYNLSGQRVGTRNNMSNLSSGIYIVAGKKVVVK